MAGADEVMSSADDIVMSNSYDVYPNESAVGVSSLGTVSSAVKKLLSMAGADEVMSSSDDIDMSNSYDAYPNESVVGVPSLGDLSMWTPTASQFIRSNAGITEDGFVWVGKQPLGQGSFGLVGLWEKIDREGNVVDVRAFSLVDDNPS